MQPATLIGGLVVISGNSQIAYRPHQAIAFIDNGLISFFPDGEWCRLLAHMRSAVIVQAWPRIEEKIAEAAKGTCWRIPCRLVEGELRLSGEPLHKLEIPDDVLETERRKKAGAKS
jgi:hypothetical protein